MILIFGGTTEGRIAVRVADTSGRSFFYSTKSDRQVVDSTHGIRLCGAMDEAAMIKCCSEHDIRLLVDAAHPFAVRLHQTIAAVAEHLQLPVIRLERQYPPRCPDFIWCEDYEDAMRRLETSAIRRLLALSGVNTIPLLKNYWSRHECWFRILDCEESRRLAERQGFPAERLLFYREGDEGKWMDVLHPDAILTKESGDTGFFREKTEAALQRNIPVYVIKRPRLPESFAVVYGEEGLRKQIERLLPEFFPLRSGYTTGACATAAAKAALQTWLTKQPPADCEICLPSGEPVSLPIYSTVQELDIVRCSVQKEAGDDPDVTNGCILTASVCVKEKKAGETEIILKGGKGIGRVTLPGLGLEVGGPAINATPRRMIIDELSRLSQQYPSPLTIEVTLSVENGEEIALRTFNPKLGIVGGISIIGTSGIVRPFSSEAFVASIKKEIQVAKAIGCLQLVINSGAKSERYLKAYLERKGLELPPQAYVHYGNFIGETLRMAEGEGFRHIIIGIMLGKAVKLAEGALDTHSKKVAMNKDYLIRLAEESDCSPSTIAAIRQMTLARELWEILPAGEQAPFLDRLVGDCLKVCSSCLIYSKLTLLLLHEDGRVMVAAESEPKMD